ncbi:unnamed protein product [Closterium sp. Naga37s-1]|nr:unnamed protein product [Closterium sp. Naga37s-1]
MAELRAQNAPPTPAETLEGELTLPAMAELAQAAGFSSAQAPRTLCSQCQQDPAKYRCPGCSAATCSVPCVKAHKAASGCTGKRNRAEFVPIGKFDDNQLVSDLRFLEDALLQYDVAKRTRTALGVRYEAQVGKHWGRMQQTARQRGVQLLLMPPGMSKRKANRTYFQHRYATNCALLSAAADAARHVQTQGQPHLLSAQVCVATTTGMLPIVPSFQLLLMLPGMSKHKANRTYFQHRCVLQPQQARHMQLQQTAKQRGVQLLLMPPGMSKRKANRTYFQHSINSRMHAINLCFCVDMGMLVHVLTTGSDASCGIQEEEKRNASLLQIAPPSTGTRSSAAFAASFKTPSSDPTASLTFSFAVRRLSNRPHPITLANLLPSPPHPGPPPPKPNLTVAATPELQAAADATFLHNRKADHDVALLNYEFASSERSTHLELIAEYNTSMAAYVPNSIAWAAADNRTCTILLGALPDALMCRFQAREMRAHLIWTELQSMFERRDISSVGVLFQEYFSITLATCDGAVDYVGRMQEVADRLAARQAAPSEPLQIHRLLFNLTPDYESRLHAFTEANPLAGLLEVTQWIIDTEVKLRTPIVNLTTTHSSSASLNATQPRTQGGRNGGSGGRGGGGGGSRGSGRGGRGGNGGGGGPSGPAPGGSSSAGGALQQFQQQ